MNSSSNSRNTAVEIAAQLSEIERANFASQEEIAVLGAGSWGTALAHLLADKGHRVRLWARDSGIVSQVKSAGENARYLPGISLRNLEISADLEAVLATSNWIVSAVPCAALPQIARESSTRLRENAVVISGTKGLHPETLLRASQTWTREANLPLSRFVVLSGPNLAREIVAGIPSSTVVASANASAASAAQQLFSTSAFRVYTNADWLGVELGGALKNVVAIAAGIGDGLGFGDNAKAAMMTRAWHEMTRLAVKLGAQERTLFGLSGLGDLIATCATSKSRNYALGVHLAQGETLGEAQHEIAQVAEGVHTCRAALRLAEEVGIELPVTRQVAAVLFEKRAPRAAVEELMRREGCQEV